MKKLLLLFMLIIPLYGITNDSTVVTNTQVTEAERIIDKYTDKVYEFAENAAKALEQPAKEVFESVVRLQIVKGVGLVLLLPVSILLWIITFNFYKISIKIGKEKYGENNEWVPDDNWQGGAFIVGVTISSILTICSIFSTYWGLQYLFAPEWWGIKEIIGLF